MNANATPITKIDEPGVRAEGQLLRGGVGDGEVLETAARPPPPLAGAVEVGVDVGVEGGQGAEVVIEVIDAACVVGAEDGGGF